MKYKREKKCLIYFSLRKESKKRINGKAFLRFFRMKTILKGVRRSEQFLMLTLCSLGKCEHKKE
jgi:hypothetical protein